MPQKITSKNLSYNSSLPPFLAALHAQASGATGPDPILAAHRRPTAKKRSGSEEAEDAPIVVDEDGNAVEDVTVDRHGTVTEPVAAAKLQDATNDDAEEKKDEKEANKSAIGGRKRKVGKIIGEDAKDDDFDKPKKRDEKVTDQSSNKKAKKKAKKIKLSFDEEEG